MSGGGAASVPEWRERSISGIRILPGERREAYRLHIGLALDAQLCCARQPDPPGGRFNGLGGRLRSPVSLRPWGDGLPGLVSSAHTERRDRLAAPTRATRRRNVHLRHHRTTERPRSRYRPNQTVTTQAANDGHVMEMKWCPYGTQRKTCLSMKVRSPMPCSCSCLSPTRSQRRRRELHGADSDMAQRLETAMAHTLRLGSLAELHG